MTAEQRVRIFVGAQELTFNKCIFIKTDDNIVNNGTMEILGNSDVVVGATIDITKADGVTTIYSATVAEIKIDTLWKVKLMTAGYELNNIFITQVYSNRSPEYIVEDLITNYCSDLVYASSDASGITLTKYVANSYLVDIITDMVTALQWQTRIDASANFYFEPKGSVNNGKTFTEGTTIHMTEWSEDNQNLMNRVKIKGGLVNYYTTESDTGDDVVVAFVLTHKPWGTVKVTLDGAEQTPSVAGTGAYSVDAENKTITFTTPPGVGVAIVFTYAFQYPVVVDLQDDASIALYGEIFKSFQAPFIDNFSDARRYARNLLDTYALPLTKGKGFSLNFDFDRDAGEIVTVTDETITPSKTDVELVIRKVTYDFIKGQTQYEFGQREYVLVDWQSETQDRIKKLERRTEDEEDIAYSRFFQHIVDISVKRSLRIDMARPVNSFILNHNTLSRLRSGWDFEADCSNSTNTHHGTWYGTAVTTGGQFIYNDAYENLISQWKFYENEGTSTADSIGSNTGTITSATWTVSGKMGPCLEFDGDNDLVEVADATALRLTAGGILEAWIYPDTDGENDRGRIFDKSTDTSGTNGYALWITTVSTNTDLHLKVNGGTTLSTTGGKITLSAWNHILAYFDGTTRYLYINGVQQATDGITDVGANIAGVVTIGNRSTTTDSTFDGKIDIPRIHSALGDYPLAETIKTIYNNSGKENFSNQHGIFNGSDRYLDTADHADLDGGTDMSISLAVKVDTLPDAEEYLYHKYDGTDGWFVRINASNQIEFGYRNGGGTIELVTCTTALTVKQFAHITFTKDDTALVAYFNGVSDGTATASSSIVGTNTEKVTAGKYSTTYFTGYLDEIKQYKDVVLTTTRALNLSNKHDELTDCVLYWSCDNPVLGDNSTNRIPMTWITVV